MRPVHLERGRRAEDRVCWYLRRRLWRVVARNWIGGGGELDLVAVRGRCLLIAEVRYRAAGEALASIDRHKLEHVLAAARALVAMHALQVYRLRVDLFGVDPRGRIVRMPDVMRLVDGNRI
ncbi:MAG: YraN family protein [Planctomycetota bacterium]